MAVRVRAPASSANLGSAFDAGALALALHNEVTAEPAGSDRATVVGEGADALRAGAPNLTIQALDRLYVEIGRPRPALALTFTNHIPFGRGLGSSAAAIAAGLRLGEALSGTALGDERLLTLAAMIEGHGDNTTAAILGGFTLCAQGATGITTIRLSPPPNVRVVLFVPDYAVSTADARAVLPAQTPRADAVFNVGRAALLAAAFATGQMALLSVAMEDRLHQPYRLPLYRAMQPLLDAARQAGAYGAAVSGAGPSAVAITSHERAPDVAEALSLTARENGVQGRTLTLEVDEGGASALTGSDSSLK